MIKIGECDFLEISFITNVQQQNFLLIWELFLRSQIISVIFVRKVYQIEEIMDLNTDIEAELADFMQVAPKMPELLEAVASKHESTTSISGEDKSKNQNLNSGLGNLDSNLDDLPPIQDQNSSADMSLATSKNQGF